MNYYPHLNDIFINERLKRQLEEVDRYSIITVIAPMGFGKTTALSWWAKNKQRINPDAVILRQIIATDSPTDFWHGFCRAFKNYPELSEQLKALGYPEDTGSVSVLAELLGDALNNSNSSIYYILDDLHILIQKSLTAMLFFLSQGLPDNVHIILLSRNQIFGEEGRMRLGNRLYEIGIEDLRFTKDEVVLYAQRCRLKVLANELKTLAELSEGWVSMIYLNFKSYVQSGHWLSSTSDIFTLIDEVLLEPLPRQQKEFLILIGIADEFTEPQAIFLWQQENGEDLLNSLSKNNAFITKNDSGIYRYHHMLRECVRQKFSEKPKEYRINSYERLGNWHLKQQEYIPAYFAFAKAEQWDRLLVVLERDKAKSLNSEHSQEFFTWMQACPETLLVRHPFAIVVCMVKMFSFHNIPEIKRMKSLLLKALEQDTALTPQEHDNLLGDAELSESFLCYNDISAMSAYHRRACALLSRTSLSVDPKGSWTFSAPSVFMMYHRGIGKADSENIEMKECMPYYYQVSDGHGNGAEHSFAADLYYERGRLIDADIANRMAMSAARRKEQFSIMLCSEFLSMRMDLFQGNYESMTKSISDSRDWLHRERQYTLLNTLDMCQGFLYALIGYPSAAPEWFAQGRLHEALVMFPATPMLHTFYNQLLIAKEEWTQVLSRQGECEKLYGVYNNVQCEIWLYIQLAVAYEQIGRTKQAQGMLKEALDRALPDGIIMPFAESGFYITELLSGFRDEGVYADEIGSILPLAIQFCNVRSNIRRMIYSGIETYGLSERELQVVRLAALRKTNSEIAKELYLAEGTVRNQLSRIYDKMGIKGEGKNKRFVLEEFLKIEKK